MAAAWTVYALLLGPVTINALMRGGWVLGIVSARIENDYGSWCPHLEALTTAVALCAGAAAAVRLRVTGRAPRWLAGEPVQLVVAIGLIVAVESLYRCVFMAKIDGADTSQQCVTAVAALLWLALLCPGSALGSREPARSRAPQTHRALMASIIGNALATPVLFALILKLVLRAGPTGLVERMVRAINAGSGWHPSFSSLTGIAAAVLNSASNAVIEEGAFALLVVLLARRGVRTGPILVVAFALRAAMHVYYGPPGLAMGVFSTVNAYALLRWKRLAPLIVAHAAYDVLISWCVTFRWFPQGLWQGVFVEAAVCIGAAGLAVIAHAAVCAARAHTARAGGNAC